MLHGVCSGLRTLTMHWGLYGARDGGAGDRSRCGGAAAPTLIVAGPVAIIYGYQAADLSGEFLEAPGLLARAQVRRAA